MTTLKSHNQAENVNRFMLNSICSVQTTKKSEGILIYFTPQGFDLSGTAINQLISIAKPLNNNAGENIMSKVRKNL